MFKTPSIKIGHYYLGKTLGVGSFGKVKLGEHELCDQKVAVKILNRKKITLLKMDEKVEREIKVLKISNHPHIIKLFEVINTSSDIFVITEYITGGELFDYIADKGRLSEDESRRFFQQMISGVDYCHKHLVVHRDLKPENLLLDIHYNIKIADFGLANIMHDGILLETSCGSPNYAAPEVIKGDVYLGPEVDVWSCGIILFALLCGSLPFDDDNLYRLYSKIQATVFDIPDHVSHSARDLIFNILKTSPTKRLTMDGIRKHPWFQTRLPRYLSFPCAKKVQFFKQTIQVDENIVKIVSDKTGIGKRFISLGIKRGEKNFFTVVYFLVRENITPFDLITIGKPHSKAEKKLINSRSYHHKGMEWPFGKYWKLAMGVKIVNFLDDSVILSEIYRAIKNFKMQWKSLSRYYLKVFVIQHTIWNKKKKYNNRREFFLPVKIGVHLYKNGKWFIIDFHRIEGDAFSFLISCDFLTKELRFF